MKKLTFTTLFFFVIAVSSMAQTWQKFNYQGVARNAMGEVIENQAIGVRFSLHEGTAVGALVYQETHSATTNEFGLFNLEIGGGTVVSGNFGTIDWGNDDYYVEVEMDPAGGTAYTDMGTTQLLSVPYALYAENAGVPGVPGPQGPVGPVGPVGPTGPLVSGGTNQTLRHNGSDWEAALNLYNNGTRVGAGDIGASNELDGVFTVRGANTSTDGIEGVFLDVINDEGNTAGTLAGIRFCNYPVTTTNDHIPGGIFWKSTGQTFGRGDLVFVTGTAGGSANVNTNARMTIDNDGQIAVNVAAPDPDARLTVDEGSLESALLLGDGGGALAYITVNQPTALAANTGGIARFRDDGATQVMIQDAAETYQLTVYGDAFASGGTWIASDRDLKRNISGISSALENLMKLNPTSYYFDRESESASVMNLPEELQYGLLAQDVQEVFPNLVRETVLRGEDGEVIDSNLHGMNYTGLIPVLIKAMQEQQTLIEQLQAQIELLNN